MQTALKQKLFILLLSTLFAFSAQASVNVLTGAFEKDWQDEVGGSSKGPQRVLRTYSSREGWSFQLQKVKPSLIRKNTQGQILSVGPWAYNYSGDRLLSASHRGGSTEMYEYDEFGNLTNIRNQKQNIKIQYDAEKDRAISIQDRCLLKIRYEEQIQSSRYQLRTLLSTQCPQQKLVQQQYRFQFRPSNEGWELQQAWETSLQGERP